MSTALVTAGSSCIMRGPRSPHIQELPALTLMISCMVAVDTPARSATCMASAAAAMCTPHSSWLIILAVEPMPASRPQSNTREPMAPSTGRARSSTSAAAEHMIVSAAALAPLVPPDTGASSTARPMSASRAAVRAACAGAWVQPMPTMAPRGSAAAAPCSNSTASACSPDTTISHSSSASRAASAALAAAWPPAATSASAAPARTSKPRTACPALTRLTAIGTPIAPRPTKPTLTIPTP